MKTILIATDFSDASRNAMFYGFEFARAMDARVILLHVYKAPIAGPDSLVKSLNDMEEQLAKEKAFIATAGPYDLETACEQESIADTILKNATALNVSMIVSGIQGRGKTVKKIFGSTATALTKH